MPRGIAILIRIVAAIAPLTTLAHAQQGPIDPNWVYVTPVHWKQAPKGFHQSDASARVVVLYPEGEYFDAGLVLIKRNNSIQFSNGDGHLYRTGTWSRTDDRAIRIHSRVVYRDVSIIGQSLPEPFSTDTCALEGTSSTHLAATIHCHSLIINPAKLTLNLADLQTLAAEAFRAAPLQ
jgi:hypothetical protein